MSKMTTLTCVAWRVARAISGFLRPPYAAIVIEFFPFGRRRFRREHHLLPGRQHQGSREPADPDPRSVEVEENRRARRPLPGGDHLFHLGDPSRAHLGRPV